MTLAQLKELGLTDESPLAVQVLDADGHLVEVRISWIVAGVMGSPKGAVCQAFLPAPEESA